MKRWQWQSLLPRHRTKRLICLRAVHRAKKRLAIASCAPMRLLWKSTFPRFTILRFLSFQAQLFVILLTIYKRKSKTTAKSFTTICQRIICILKALSRDLAVSKKEVLKRASFCCVLKDLKFSIYFCTNAKKCDTIK